MSGGVAYGIQSLVHRYDGKIALDIPRLDIPSGQICAFTGPNGSGKTTLLSILALLLTPSSGMVLIDGVAAGLKRDRRLRRKVTLVHQKPALFAATVRRNIAYGLHAHGCPHRDIRRRVQAILEEMGLSAVADKSAAKISGGEAQRTVLARALVLETPIILLDEPTNSLDDASRPTLSRLLLAAKKERGATIVIAAHDTNFIDSIADEVFRLEQGKILD